MGGQAWARPVTERCAGPSPVQNGPAQATWRHALFGVLLGVLEARLNRAPAAPGGDPAHNGRPAGIPATYTAPVAPE